MSRKPCFDRFYLLRLAATKMSGMAYWANHCEACGAIQGDHYIHEADGPYWPQDDSALSSDARARTGHSAGLGNRPARALGWDASKISASVGDEIRKIVLGVEVPMTRVLDLENGLGLTLPDFKGFSDYAAIVEQKRLWPAVKAGR
jgi:hypothetical protein